MSRQPAEDGKEQDQAVGDASFELVERADADDHSIRMLVDKMIEEIEATVIQRNLASSADEAVPLNIVQDATSSSIVIDSKLNSTTLLEEEPTEKMSGAGELMERELSRGNTPTKKRKDCSEYKQDVDAEGTLPFVCSLAPALAVAEHVNALDVAVSSSMDSIVESKTPLPREERLEEMPAWPLGQAEEHAGNEREPKKQKVSDDAATRQQEVEACNSVMQAAALQNRKEDVIKLYKGMRETGMLPNKQTLAIIESSLPSSSYNVFKMILPDLKAACGGEMDDAQQETADIVFSREVVLEAAIQMANQKYFDLAHELFCAMWRSEAFVTFFKNKTRCVEAMEAYLQVCLRLKQMPLSNDRLLDYTGLMLSSPKAVSMWSRWISAEASSGNVKNAQEVLDEMNDSPGIIAEQDAELDVIASAVAFNVSVPIALQSLQRQKEEGKLTSLMVEELMGKILERSSTGRPQLQDSVLKQVMKVSEGELTKSSYDAALQILLRAKKLKAAEDIMGTMDESSLPVSAEAKVVLVKLKALKGINCESLEEVDKEEIMTEDPEIPKGPDKLADFLLKVLKVGRMDLAGEAWLLMHSLHGNACARQMVDDVVMGFAAHEAHEEVLDLLEEAAGIPIKEATFERVLKSHLMHLGKTGSMMQTGGENPKAVEAILRWKTLASIDASSQTLLRLQARTLEALAMIGSKTASEEIMVLWEQMRDNGTHKSSEILDLVATAAGCLQDMQAIVQVFADAKQWGLTTSTAMKGALCSCHAAQGDTWEALALLEGMECEAPPECIKILFQVLLKEGEWLRAKALVSKYGDNGCFLEELVQALVSSDLAMAVEVSRGNLSKCSEEMAALITFLGGGQEHAPAGNQSEQKQERAEQDRGQ